MSRTFMDHTTFPHGGNGCIMLECDLSKWNVSKVQHEFITFSGCKRMQWEWLPKFK